MNARRYLNILVLVVLILANKHTSGLGTPLLRNSADALADPREPPAALVRSAKSPQSGESPQQSSSTEDEASQANTNAQTSLSESQKSLMAGSKTAILKTGMSEPYFDRHFRIVEVFDKPGDRRVVWTLSINEYEARINDSIGYYTEGGKRIDVHSVGNILSSTTDIERTIPRTKALKIMRACLGKFADTAVEYRAGGSGKAGLFLTAASIPKSVRLSPKEIRERERKRKERESRERAMKAKREGDTDVIEEEEENDRPPIFLGVVNLETGKCTRGIAQAGPPKVR